MTSITGRTRRGFTLVELAVVIAIIFILAGSLVVVIPQVETKAAIAKAKGDIQRLHTAISMYQENEGVPPPDRLDLVRPSTPIADSLRHNYSGTSPELQSNVLLLHHLTTRRSRTGYLLVKAKEVSLVGKLERTNPSLDANVGDSSMVPIGRSNQVNAYAFLDPWRNPYVYDNNIGDTATVDANLDTNLPLYFLMGLPNNNTSFDLYSMGPNQKTARGSASGWRNGIDDDGNGTIDDRGEVALNGQERTVDGDLGDDINNWDTQ